MNGLDLSRGGAELPVSVWQGDCEYPIRSGHRAILRTLRMLADPEIGDADKPLQLRRMFFVGAAAPDAEQCFQDFVRCGKPDPSPGGERDFDYDEDAAEIYSAFRQLYRIDLLETEMHWWVFSALLDGIFCTDNALSNKLRIRHADDGEGKRKAAMERQKMAVKLPERISRSDAAIEKEVLYRLEHGLPLDDLLTRR